MNNASSVYFSHMNYIADIGSTMARSRQILKRSAFCHQPEVVVHGDVIQTTTQNPDGTGQTSRHSLLRWA